MPLLKVTELDKIEIIGVFKHVQCRTTTWVEDNGVMIGGKQYHRHVISPNDDVSGESTETQAIVAAVHTQEVKDAYAAHLAEQEQAPREGA